MRLLAIAIDALLVLGLAGAALPGVRNSREDLAVIRPDADRTDEGPAGQVREIDRQPG